MKICQNINCLKKQIERETAIFCPYCGHYQVPTGWHYPKMAIDNELNHSPNENNRPDPKKMDKMIKAVLIEENQIIIQFLDEIVIYETAQLASNDFHSLWHTSIPSDAQMVILRPYLLLIEYNKIRGIHLQTKMDVRLPTELEFQQESRNMQISDCYLPFERPSEGGRQACLFIGIDRALWVFILNSNNIFEDCVPYKLNIKGQIAGMQTVKEEKDLLFIYTRRGETRLIDIQCFFDYNYDDKTASDGSIQLICDQSDGAFEVEWAILKGNDIYYLARALMSGQTYLMRYYRDKFELINDHDINFKRKIPSYSLRQPYVLFEDSVMDHLIWIYSFQNNRLFKINFHTSRLLNLEHNQFNLRFDRLIYFNNKYWAVIPTQSNFILMEIDINESRMEITGRPVLNIPLKNILTDQPSENLPIIPIKNGWISHYNDNIILL